MAGYTKAINIICKNARKCIRARRFWLDLLASTLIFVEVLQKAFLFANFI